MSIARIYIEGQPWEIMGNISDSFLNFSNEATPSRSGRNFAKTTAKVRKLTIDEIKVVPAEAEAFNDYFKTCGTRRFPLTVAIAEGCDGEEDFAEWIYTRAMIEGEPVYSLFDNNITGFEISYEDRFAKLT